jgi:hypothetical protein
VPNIVSLQDMPNVVSLQHVPNIVFHYRMYQILCLTTGCAKY